MLNEFTQEFVESIMKPSGDNRPSSDKIDTIHQATVVIPYVKGILIANRFNARKFSQLNKHSMGHR
jgi:hypothetical protein